MEIDGCFQLIMSLNGLLQNRQVPSKIPVYFEKAHLKNLHWKYIEI